MYWRKLQKKLTNYNIKETLEENNYVKIKRNGYESEIKSDIYSK